MALPALRFPLTSQAEGLVGGFRKADQASKRTAAQTRRLRARMRELRRTTDRVTGSMKRMAAGLLAVAGVGGVGGIAFAFKRSVEWTDQLVKLSRVLELPPSQLLQWQHAMEISGGTMQQFQVGMRSFVKNIGDMQAGTGELITVLRRVAPELENQILQYDTVDERLQFVLDHLNGMEDQFLRTSLASAIFGSRSAQAFLRLAPSARELRAEAERLGLVLDKGAGEAAESLADRFTELGTIWRVNFANAVLGNSEAIQSFFINLRDRMPEITSELGKIAVAAGNFLANIDISGLVDNWDKFIDKIKVAAIAIAAFIVASNPIASLVALIGTGVALIALSDEDERRLKELQADIVRTQETIRRGPRFSIFGTDREYETARQRLDEYNKEVAELLGRSRPGGGVGRGAIEEHNALARSFAAGTTPETESAGTQFRSGRDLGSGLLGGDDIVERARLEDEKIKALEEVRAERRRRADDDRRDAHDALAMSFINAEKRKDAEVARAEAERLALVEEAARERAAIEESLQSQFASGFSNAFLDFVDGTKSAREAFRDFAKSFLRQIAQMIIQQKIFNALKAASGGGSGFFGSIAGFLAGGGPAYAGRSYVVGERGPELFTPNVSGYVTPNNELTGFARGRSGTINNIYIHPSVDRPSIRAEVSELLPQISAASAGETARRGARARSAPF